jgi:hypothetical protein
MGAIPCLLVGMAYLLIVHNPTTAQYLRHRAMVMDLGYIVESASAGVGALLRRNPSVTCTGSGRAYAESMAQSRHGHGAGTAGREQSL